MSRTFEVWLDSGANMHSCYKQTVTLDDIGVSEEEWEAMSEEAKDEIMRDIAFNRGEWGWVEA